MADLMATAHAWLSAKRKSYRSQTATYTRSGEAPLSISATPLGHAGRTLELDPARLMVEELDWVVQASEIEALGEPQRGDVIAVEHNGTTYRYEAVADESGRWWEWSNPTLHTEYRVHTKYAGTA